VRVVHVGLRHCARRHRPGAGRDIHAALDVDRPDITNVCDIRKYETPERSPQARNACILKSSFPRRRESIVL
jgi:hypothetical protein